MGHVPLGLAGLLATLLASPASGEARLISDLPYAGEPAEGRSLDLFLPTESTSGAAPLLVFVHSRFWDRADRARDVAGRFARPLQRAGVAVAVVRHRLAPDHPHPAAAEDVAAAVAFLLGRAAEYGFDPDRLYLAGRSSGAQLAALLALDSRYLEAHGLSRERVRGVAAWSGIYDLDPPDGSVDEALLALYANAFGNAQERREASPLRHVSAEGPIFLLLVAQQDLPGAAQDAAAFALALREAGHPAAEIFLVAGRDHMNMLDMGDAANPARQHVFTLLGLDDNQGSIEQVFETRRFWRDPTFSTQGFWVDERQVETHESDARFLQTLNLMFARRAGPPPLQPRTYRALDLLAWVDRHVPGDGDFLTLTNARGEQVVWRRSELAAYRPRLVIGLDEERELFKLTDFYHTRRRYTWSQPEEEPWVMARPLGAFVHFGEPAPERIDPLLFGRFGLTPDSFSVSEEDPLAALRDLLAPERTLLLEEFRCVSCHSFRGAGARAGHLRARDGERVGGFGLALEEYPPQAWRRYCFEQQQVAEEIGATPVALGSKATLLFELVERERGRAQ